MDTGEAVRAVLEGDAAVNALAQSRIYPVVIPQNGRMPCVTYQRVSGHRSNGLDGSGDLLRARVQVDCWDKTYRRVRELARAVTKAMLGAGHLHAGERDGFEDEVAIYRVILEFFVWNKEE